MKTLRHIAATAAVGLLLGLSGYCAVHGSRNAVTAVARELAAYRLSAYHDGWQDGFAAGLGRRGPDPAIALRE